MPRKKSDPDDKSRGPCSLEAVKQYLMSDLIPEGYNTKSERRVLQRRAKSFVLIGDDLYFTGGRSKHYRGSTENETGDTESAENDAEDTHMLRKVVLSEDEQQEIVRSAHTGEDGSHFGVEKTTELVSNHYYWKGITYCIRNAILACPKCKARVKTSGPFHLSEINNEATNSSCHASSTASGSVTAKDVETADVSDEKTEDEDEDEDDGVKGQNRSVKQETSKVADDFRGTSQRHKLRTRLPKGKKKAAKSARKFSADRRKWGACSSLEKIKEFLISNTVPEGYNKNDRRVLLRRAKSFVLIKDDLYFTGGRSKQKKGLNNDETGTENSETETEETPVLRKVVFSEEEKQEILRAAHIGKDGSHQGMEKTKEQVSNEYYWMGITYGVRNIILDCSKCSSRSKTPAQTFINAIPTPTRFRMTCNKNSSPRKSKVANRKRKEGGDDVGSSGKDEDGVLSDAGFAESRCVKEERSAEDRNSKRESSQTGTDHKPTKKEQRKSTPIDRDRSRGACCSLEVVKQHLQTNKVPDGYNRNDRRALLRRAKSFVMIKDDMYFTGGRSKQFGKSLNDSDRDADDPEDEPDHTQVLRKVVLSREEQQEVLNRAHIGDDGSHYGVEKTTERVSTYYYWLGITYGVRMTISNCPSCSSRSKNPSRSLPFPSSLSDTTPSLGNNLVSAETTNTLAAKTCEPATSSWDVEMEDEHEDGDDYDGSELNKEESRQSEGEGMESQSVKQEATVWPLDIVTLSREVCSYFWQKVEIQMFGPYQAGKKQIFVAIALDTYSQFPEAITMEVLSSATLTNFLLNLFCRYGVMEKVLLLQNETTRNKDLYFNMQDLLQAGISPVLQCPMINALDERWNHIEKSLVRFISQYPDFWFHCLEAFMVPLRITLPPEAVYSPYYLVHGREASVPDQLSQVYNAGSSGHTEVQLTEDQEKQTVDMVTAAYGIHSDNPSFPVTLPQPPSMEESVEADTIDEDERPKEENQEMKSVESKERHKYGRHGRLRACRNEVIEVSRKRNLSDDEVSDMETGEAVYVPSEDGTEAEDDSDIDASYTPNIKAVDKKSPVPVKRKRGRPLKMVLSNVGGSSDLFKINLERKKTLMGLQSSLIKNMQQLPLDTFYYIVKQYLEHEAFPPGMSSDTRQTISRLCSMFYLKDGKLYSSVGKSAGRLIVTSEKTRFSLLRKAHARGEMHHGRSTVLKYLSDLNVFWNGMSLDLDAFIHCCPECTHHNPLGNLLYVHIPSKSACLTVQGRKEDEPHMSEDDDEESSYEDLIQFLTDNTFPPSTTPCQQQRIQERSKSFRIIKGSLHYQTPAMTEPLQVLFSDSLKHTAIQEAHMENGAHLSQQDSQARLRRQYFWSGMTLDVVKHVIACCMKEAMSTAPVLHRNPVIQERVDKMRSYYTEGKIPKLDTSAVMATEVREKNGDTSVSKADRSSSAPSFILDHAVIRTLKTVIEGIDKQLSGKNKKAEKKEDDKGDLTKSSSNTRIQKANKCQFCGKYFGGTVAYKIHLYKHTGVKPFICSSCGKSFTTNRSLLIHSRKHTGIKPYLCNQCGRGFFRSASLLYHLRAHAVGRGTPVSCDVCHRSFSTHHRLTRHKEFKHPAQAKVYICNQCGKHFTAARSLKRHEQIHSGHRKYQCHYCSKSFFRKEYLNAHLTNHTEHEQEAQKVKPREKLPKKFPPRSDDSSTYWAQSDQSSHHVEAASMSDMEAYQNRAVISQPSLPNSSVTSTHISLIPNNVMAHSQMVHHSLHHPITQTARLINVAGSHGALPLTVSSVRPPAEAMHAGNGAEILLQHDVVPVQFGVECLSGEGANLSEVDLSTIQLLAQANIPGPNLHSL